MFLKFIITKFFTKYIYRVTYCIMNDISHLHTTATIAISISKRITDGRLKTCKLYKTYCRLYGIKFTADCVVGLLCLVQNFVALSGLVISGFFHHGFQLLLF